jgi:hypothetical protein
LIHSCTKLSWRKKSKEFCTLSGYYDADMTDNPESMVPSSEQTCSNSMGVLHEFVVTWNNRRYESTFMP